MIKIHQPCPDCGSSDALAEYEDHTFCFACSKYTNKINVKENIEKNIDGTTLTTGGKYDSLYYRITDRNTISIPSGDTNNNKYNSTRRYTNSTTIINNYNNNYRDTNSNTMRKLTVNWRGILKETFEYYDCYFLVDDSNTPIECVFPYNGGAAKHRLIADKNFYSSGSMQQADLFGQHKFGAGTAKAITITEGELDCLSAFQMLGSKYPVITFKASSAAAKECANQYKYINSFEKIYICLDADDVGHRTTQAIASLFDPNKVYIVELQGGELKDANDYLTKGKQADFVKLWWAAKKFLPKGIVNEYSAIKEILGRQSASSLASYPFPTLNEMTYGIREGELNLFTAMEKVGKTEVIRAIEHHLLKTTDYNIGIIHLEEGEKRSIQGLLSYELDTPVHLPDSSVSIDDQLKAYEALTKREGRLNFYTHFGSDDPDTILGAIRYMVSALGCKFVFLDHITMLVTGYEGDDERRKLDYISTRLAMLTRELKFTLFLVSHVNDDGKTRGSRNISKVADLIVHLDRNIEADSIDGRNTTALLVKGNRFAAKSGPAGYLWFDTSKYQVKEKEIEDVLVELPEPF